MAKVKHLLLAAVLFTFLGVTAWTTWHYDRASRLLTTHTQLSAWSLAQLELEVSRFRETLNLYILGKADDKALSLNYDMAWNRLDTFLTSKETAVIRERFEAKKIAGNLFTTLKRYESNIAMPSRDSVELQQLSGELNVYLPQIHDLTVKNFTGLNSLQQSEQIEAFKHENYIAIAVLLLVGLTMLIIMFHDSKRQYFLAWHDQLTKLPNRSSFNKKLIRKTTSKHPEQIILCLLDLNSFKEVNDSLGHLSGDRLLTLIAEQLIALKRDNIDIARIGSDEFALVLHGNIPDDEWFALSRQVFNQIDKALHGEDPAHRIRLNMGISQFPQHATSAEELILFADLALSTAKQSEGLHYQIFNHDMLAQYQRKRLLTGQLREQIQESKGRELYLCYQPIINHSKKHRLGVELLIRWNHPTLKFINPQHIIEIAEENGMGEALGEWIFRRMNRDIERIPREQLARIDFSINLSSSMFHEGLADNVVEWLSDGPLKPEQIVLELTESIALEDLALSRRIFSQIKAKSLRIALDDFGTGWSSFSYLKELSFDKLKIDKSFITNIDQDERLPLFVVAISGLSHALGIVVVAEGIETESELKTILTLGANEIQGYYYSKPLTQVDFIQFANRHFIQIDNQPDAVPSSQDQDTH